MIKQTPPHPRVSSATGRAWAIGLPLLLLILLIPIYVIAVSSNAPKTFDSGSAQSGMDRRV